MYGIALIEPAHRRIINRSRVAHFATADGWQPSLVPICFVLIGSTVYQALDGKPKRGDVMSLRRVRNVGANPNAVLLVDHYEEDWRRLWWVSLAGEARVLTRGPELARALAALRRKYPQYRDGWPLDRSAPVIALDVRRLRHWRSSSPGRRRAARSDPGA
jgi:PPOX class probable F420-dependent enzyme